MWNKLKRTFRMFSSPDELEIVEKQVQPSNGSCQRVVKVKVTSSDVLKRQLDPKTVTIDSLIENGITIEPGNFFNVMNETDPAAIEELDNSQLEKIYNFLETNKERLFRTGGLENEGGEEKKVEESI